MAESTAAKLHFTFNNNNLKKVEYTNDTKIIAGRGFWVCISGRGLWVCCVLCGCGCACGYVCLCVCARSRVRDTHVVHVVVKKVDRKFLGFVIQEQKGATPSRCVPLRGDEALDQLRTIGQQLSIPREKYGGKGESAWAGGSCEGE